MTAVLVQAHTFAPEEGLRLHLLRPHDAQSQKPWPQTDLASCHVQLEFQGRTSLVASFCSMAGALRREALKEGFPPPFDRGEEEYIVNTSSAVAAAKS